MKNLRDRIDNTVWAKIWLEMASPNPYQFNSRDIELKVYSGYIGDPIKAKLKKSYE